MAKRLDNDDRNILEYRPNIVFIEPESEEQEIDPIPVGPQIEDVKDKRFQVLQLAKAVNALATVLQTQADVRAKNVVIALKMPIDANAIQSMKRLHPEADPTQIAYDQYAECKERLMQTGEDIGKKALTTPDNVADARNVMVDQDPPFSKFGGWNTDESRNGLLRPEADDRNEIIPPLDLAEFQDIMMKILVNFLWKVFIKPAIPLPGIPDELVAVDPGVMDSLLAVGIIIPGEKKPKKQPAPEIPESLPEEDV